MKISDNKLISAKVIEDSITKGYGDRLITLELTAPKWLDAEFEKHRMISSNSSSSRAIPFKRTLYRTTFVPSDVRYNEKGMQGFKELSDVDQAYFTALVEELYDKAVDIGKTMDKELDIHKQHINRFLEPWSIQRKVATTNFREWVYFLGLRNHPAADPAIQDLARKIKYAIDESYSNCLHVNEWHLPYVTKIEKVNCNLGEKIAHSVARCARVSYDNFDGKLSDIDEDMKLTDFLAEAKHLSCFEHTAKATIDRVDVSESIDEIFTSLPHGVTHIRKDGSVMSGNFKGFIQYRQMI